MLKTTAIILSGGKNTRMNYRNKAFLKIDNKSLIETILKKVSKFEEVILVTNNPSEYKKLGVKVITDIIPFQGPLSGIHSGLIYAKYDHSIVLPCDMPFVSVELLKYMADIAEEYDIVVPKVNNHYQPLCGIYNKNCIKPIENCLRNSQNKVSDIYSMLKVREVSEKEISVFGSTESMFLNINNPSDYDKIMKKDDTYTLKPLYSKI